MSPEEMAALKAAGSVLGALKEWPVALTIVACVLGPWVFSFLVSRGSDRRHAEVVSVFAAKHAEAVKMYEDNVQLVKQTLSLGEDFRETVELNTAVMTQVGEAIRGNMFCPLVRQHAQPDKIAGGLKL